MDGLGDGVDGFLGAGGADSSLGGADAADADGGTECDLPGCDVTSPHEEDDPADPPPGWLSVVVFRHSAQSVSYVFCSQDHLVAGLRDHLHPPMPEPEPGRSGLSDLGCGALVVLLLVALAVGALTLLGWLLDLVG